MAGQWARLRGSAFARDTAVLVVGTAGAQLIAVGSLPLLSRLHAPAAFGHLAVFTAVASICSTLITWRYETVVMLPKDEDESHTLLALALRLALVCGLVLTTVAVLPLPWPWAAMAELGPWLAAATLTGIGTAWLAVGNVALSRQRAYRRLAVVRVGQSALFLVVAIVLVGTPSGLMVAHGAAVSIVAIALVRGIARPFAPAGRWTFSAAARAHASAPRYLLPTALLDTFSNQLPVLVIATQWGHAAAGEYGIAWRILALPATLVGTAVAQVFYQSAAAAMHEDRARVKRQFTRVSLALGAFALPAAITIALLGDTVFPWALGGEWTQAGHIAEWLVLSMAMYFVFSPTSVILIVLGRPRLLLVSSLIQLAYRLTIAALADGLMQYVRWLVIAECLNVVAFVAVVVWALNRSSVDRKGDRHASQSGP